MRQRIPPCRQGGRGSGEGFWGDPLVWTIELGERRTGLSGAILRILNDRGIALPQPSKFFPNLTRSGIASGLYPDFRII
ncbi:hypothetical protein TRIP_E220103 [uncultured Spirochaetota bacterium]|uniref:Uncharacterized protein n=1 Tax=uncultured Spirochaetota bacterium TaxID=460511 RepID=A0A652ZVL8_9SPIR|nr:hypothetical protein TRIP_E220103 [uncultured Spirochaetota bacterium]